MKRVIIAIIALLTVIAVISGCSKTGNITQEKNLTLEQAAELAMNKVYELTTNKDIIDKNGMRIHNATQVDDRWDIVLEVSHTLIKTQVYNNGTVKITPYRMTK